MFFIGTDMFEGDGAAATFHSLIKTDTNGRVLVKVYATSGMTSKDIFVITQMYTTESAGTQWLQPLVHTASNKGLVGIASASIAAGCVGWVTVRGPVDNVSSPATVEMTGSIGHAISWFGASGIGASSSAYSGAVHQIGFLLEEATGTLAANVFLTGNQYAQSI
jgi:hypothetical protein